MKDEFTRSQRSRAQTIAAICFFVFAAIEFVLFATGASRLTAVAGAAGLIAGALFFVSAKRAA